ncbi:MAG: Trk system potassium transporter TrkA [Ruminococcaceae bacterium]|nr:Trk system potassium transporter TrkA [Oscillospiraceae bacterium]
MITPKSPLVNRIFNFYLKNENISAIIVVICNIAYYFRRTVMNIVIVGAGVVGAAICAQLALENHNITLVDTNYSALTDISNRCDVFGVIGNGADLSTLKKASVDKADLLIAVTSSDEINILCCAAAKKLGVKSTIARVRNPEYSELMSFMRSELNLSMTINPELAVAKEIYRMLRFPSATKTDTFCRGRVDVAQFTVSKDSSICGSTLNELRSKLNIRFLVCATLRDGEALIPTGHFTIEAGDVLCVTAPEDEITKFFKAIGVYKHPVKNILISGGGRTTYYLEALLKKGKIKSTVIEKNEKICRELAEDFDCTVICNDSADQNVLLEEGLANADAFLALSNEDEENAIVSMYAKTKTEGRIITMIKSISYVDLFRGVGLDSIVSPKTSTATYIMRYVRSMANVRSSEIESLQKLMDDRVEALEFLIKQNIPELTNIPLKELKLRRGVLIACIVHNDKVIIPSGNDVISRGDTVIIITTEAQIKEIGEILK